MATTLPNLYAMNTGSTPSGSKLSKALEDITVERECSECNTDEETNLWGADVDEIMRTLRIRSDMTEEQWIRRMEFLNFMDYLVSGSSNVHQSIGFDDIIDLYIGRNSVRSYGTSSGGMEYQFDRKPHGPNGRGQYSKHSDIMGGNSSRSLAYLPRSLAYLPPTNQQRFNPTLLTAVKP